MEHNLPLEAYKSLVSWCVPVGHADGGQSACN